MGQNTMGVQVSLLSYASPGRESKHYFNACATGVLDGAERIGREEAEAEMVQLSPPSGTTVKLYHSVTFVSKGERCVLLLAWGDAGEGNSRLTRVNRGKYKLRT
jgi:hypothetical protein